MDAIQLGATGLRVSPFGIGLAALGRPGYITLGHGADLGHDYDVGAMTARTHRVLDRAYDLGVRYFDAARSYGRAEEFLGVWLRKRELAPEAVVVASKWGYTYTAQWQVHAAQHEVKQHTLAVLQRQWQESRTQLGAHLDLYQIHSATLESGVLANRPVLNELARLKNAGVAVGLSVSGPQQAETLDRALAITIDGVRLFDAVQATWNLLETSAGPALARVRDAGLGIIVKEALANGRLTEANRASGFANKLKVLRVQAQRLETSVDGLSLAAVRAQPWVDVVLSGAATTAQLESNLGAGRVRWDAQAAAALSGLQEPPEAYWEQRSKLSWN